MKKIVAAMLIATLSLTGCNSVSGIDQSQLDNDQNVNVMSAPAKNGAFAGKNIEASFKEMTKGTGFLDKVIFEKQIMILTDDKEFSKLALDTFNKSDLNKDGKLNLDEFKNFDIAFDKVLAKKGASSEEEAITKLFNQMKDSHSGVSEKAFIAFNSGGGFTKAERDAEALALKEVFVAIDTDKNHLLSFSELKKSIDAPSASTSNKNGFSDLSGKDKMKWILMAPVMWVFAKMGWLHIQ